jgi:hypothetical protein
MRHPLTGVVLAIFAGLILTSSASAITIYDIRGQQLLDGANWWDPTKNGGLTFGASAFSLMWNKIDSDGKTLLAGGRPTGDYSNTWAPANPAWLNFKTGSPNTGNGTGPYQPSGILSGTVIPRLYTLESWDKSREFDFSVFFYDPLMTLTGSQLVATVILTGNFGTHADSKLKVDPFNVIALSADQVRAGIMATFDVGCEAGEEVAVTIETKDTYAAGFFIDKVKDWTPPAVTSLSDPLPAAMVVPEPATIALLALGLGGLMRRRFRK